MKNFLNSIASAARPGKCLVHEAGEPPPHELHVFPDVEMSSQEVERPQIGDEAVDHRGPVGAVHGAGADVDLAVRFRIRRGGVRAGPPVVVRVQVENEEPAMAFLEVPEKGGHGRVEPVVLRERLPDQARGRGGTPNLQSPRLVRRRDGVVPQGYSASNSGGSVVRRGSDPFRQT